MDTVHGYHLSSTAGFYFCFCLSGSCPKTCTSMSLDTESCDLVVAAFLVMADRMRPYYSRQ